MGFFVHPVVAPSLDAALARVEAPPPPFCIGGSELFALALPRATVLHLTEIERDYAGDASFPPLDARVWRETARERHEGGGADRVAYSYVTYERRSDAA